MDLQEARRREAALHDPSTALAAGQRLGQQWSRFMDRLAPRGRVRRIILGLCTAVDPMTHTATFLVPGVPGQTTWHAHYGYPWRAPRVGEQLPVFIADVGASQMAWVEPPGGVARWLYFRQFGGPEGGTLWRCQWPPTADAVVEQCQYVAVGAGAPPVLQDWHQGTGSLYCQNAPWPGYPFPEDMPGGLGTDIERIPRWGFDTPAVTRLDDPWRSVLGTVPLYPTDDPAAVPFSFVLPSARTAYTDYLGNPGYYTGTEAIGYGVGLTGWTVLTTVEWDRVIETAGPPPGLGPQSNRFFATVVGGGGYRDLFGGPSGFVLTADVAGLGNAGDAILALPTAAVTNYAVDMSALWGPRYTTAPGHIRLVSGSPSFALGSTMAAPDWSAWVGNRDPGGTWRQASDGTWVWYRPVAGAVDDFGGTLPVAWYVGTGADVTNLTWRALGIPATDPLAPGNLLAVSLDGQDVLAWSGGESSSGTRYYSTDAGATWTEVGQLTLHDNNGDYFAFDDMLLVDIPSDSPYAEPQA